MYEVNFDALVGPTHNYAGLSYGNIASMGHKGTISHPKQAALQGLKKMKLLADLGLKQAVLPPQERPLLTVLRSFGFAGDDSQVLQKAYKQAPLLLFSASSSSNMWAANTATVTPSRDALDGRVHMTIANLNNRFHRSLEAPLSFALFKKIFPTFVIHPPLHNIGDEGAANHTRFCNEYAAEGIHLFVYGQKWFEEKGKTLFPARAALESAEAIVRSHKIDPKNVVFAEQNPAVIEKGVFHNDVIAVGNQNLFFCHELAYTNTTRVLEELQSKIKLNVILIKEKQLPVEEAVRSYLFNSQIIKADNKTILVAPIEAKGLKLDLPFDEIFYVDLRQSMQNGGGPACLRLRVVLTEKELSEVHPYLFLDNALYQALTNWVEKHYRDNLYPEDLATIELYHESLMAIEALNKILRL